MSFGQAAVATKLICSGDFFFNVRQCFNRDPTGLPARKHLLITGALNLGRGFNRRTVALIWLQRVLEVISEFLSQLVLLHEEQYRLVHAGTNTVCHFVSFFWGFFLRTLSNF